VDLSAADRVVEELRRAVTREVYGTIEDNGRLRPRTDKRDLVSLANPTTV
jgi:hypothetical protein